MAKVVKQNYRQMINSLYNGARQITENADEMATLSGICVVALGEDDSGAEQLHEQTKDLRAKYYQCAQNAISIANAMQEELEAAEKEDGVWDSQDMDN